MNVKVFFNITFWESFIFGLSGFSGMVEPKATIDFNEVALLDRCRGFLMLVNDDTFRVWVSKVDTIG